MRIQHNIMAMNAYRNYTNNVSAMKKNLEKLSSGYKINRAGDDAAGLAISEKMRAQITGLETAQKNAKDGISLVQTAEGALTEVHDMLNRMVELATQSANGTYDNTTDRYQLQKELDQLRAEINRIADSANFNGIKLLDGSMDADGTIGLTTNGVDAALHLLPAGVNVNEAEAGGGSKGTYTISIDQLFGSDDELTISFGAGAALVTAGMVQGNPDLVETEGAADVDALINLNTGGTVTLTFGENFDGTTLADQAKSIAEALEQIDEITAQFDIDVVDNKVILTNKIEGNDQGTVTKVETNSANTTAIVTLDTATSAAKDGTAGTFTLESFFAGGTAWDFEEGQTLSFEITDSNGNTWTAKLKLDDKIFKDAGQPNKTTWDNIVAALTATDDDKAIYFEDNDKTVADESKIKFSDLFTASVSGDDLLIEDKDKGGVFGDGTCVITAKLLDSSNKATKTATTALKPGATAGSAAIVTFGLDATNGDSNFSYGDKLTFTGTLSDGGEFEIEVTLDEELIGEDLAATLKNLADYLTKSKDTTKITYKDGDKVTDEREVALKDIFSADAKKNEFMVEVDTTGDAFLKITSQVEGSTHAGAITNIEVDPAKVGSLQSDLRAGVQKTSASSSLTLDETLEAGAKVTVGGKTYQFVADAADADDGNTAIVLEDFSDTAAAVKALKEQLEKDLSEDDYTVSVSGNTLTVTTTAKGSDVSALEMTGAGKTHYDAEFQLQADKVLNGSTITIQGQKFEFVDSKDGAAKASGEGNIAVAVDLSKSDSVSLAEALKAAIVDAGIASDEEVTIAEDGTVRICSDAATPEGIDGMIKFENGHSLTLQIGDTAESFNQLRVNIGDTHTWALGISQISIADQDSAAKAIDAIKAAINTVSDIRGTLGATQNRLDHTINNLSVMTENIQDAESTIRDVDIAEEMMAYTKNNILIQSAQAMLAQANQIPQGVLQLLQ